MHVGRMAQVECRNRGMSRGYELAKPVVLLFPTMYLHERHPSQSRRIFGEMIRKARHARGLSQERLGEWAWLHQSVISRIETGQPIGLRYRTLLRLIDALGIASLEATFAPWHPWSADAESDDEE